ncbi:MAG: asparagine synthase (glutamine-hydrolyzing) [Deltaproteobacteria bacterium]|nr:asparagine synthase (glutamine-hydrolyzing) [Deltaproteobacteria bacterium]
MCGISGIISLKLPEDEMCSRLERMGRIQRHRGPDDASVKVYCHDGRASVGFGFVRLSILDLATGMQPIRSPADNVAIICNGQIYNYLELKPLTGDIPYVTKGDIEVGLHLYRCFGIDFLSRLNGMYAGAVYDPGRSRVVLFRDRFGIKPLYYATSKEGFGFSSEIRPLLSGLNLKPEINTRRIETYFKYRYVPGSETLFAGIKRLPPGSFLVFDLNTNKHEIRRYWEYPSQPTKRNINLNAAAEEFTSLFRDAVKIRLRSDVPVGSFISGGIDSSAVASEAAILCPEINLFTISFEEAKYDELAHVRRFVDSGTRRFSRARLYTDKCGHDALSRLPGIVSSMEEPVSLGTIIPTDQVCCLASQKVKAVLTGEGADEIFCGYRKFMLEMAAHCLPNLSPARRKALFKFYPELQAYVKIRSSDPVKRYIQPEMLFSSDEFIRLTGMTPGTALFETGDLPVMDGREDPLNAAVAIECRSRLSDYVILRLDKLSMAHSLEARTPFLDFRLAEFAASLPMEMKANVNLNREKFICGYAFVKYGILDATSAFRRKQPFTIPMADWLADSSGIPDVIDEIISGDMVRSHNILNPDYVSSLASAVTGKGVGPETLVSTADRLFSIIIFTLWYQGFIHARQC